MSKSADESLKQSIKKMESYKNIKKIIEVFGSIFGNVNFLLDTPYQVLKAIDTAAPWLSPFTAVFRALLNLYKMIRPILVSEKSSPRMVMKIVIPAFRLSVTILGFILAGLFITAAAPVLLIVGCAGVFLQYAWKLATAIYDRFFGSGKKLELEIFELEKKLLLTPKSNPEVRKAEIEMLTEKYNLLSKMNGKITNRLHDLAIGIVTLVGGILCLFPPLFPVGILILTIITVYSIATTDLSRLFPKLNPKNPLVPVVNAYKAMVRWYNTLIKGLSALFSPSKPKEARLYAEPGKQREIQHIEHMLHEKEKKLQQSSYTHAEHDRLGLPRLNQKEIEKLELKKTIATLFGLEPKHPEKEATPKKSFKKRLGI